MQPCSQLWRCHGVPIPSAVPVHHVPKGMQPPECSIVWVHESTKAELPHWVDGGLGHHEVTACVTAVLPIFLPLGSQPSSCAAHGVAVPFPPKPLPHSSPHHGSDAGRRLWAPSFQGHGHRWGGQTVGPPPRSSGVMGNPGSGATGAAGSGHGCGQSPAVRTGDLVLSKEN